MLEKQLVEALKVVHKSLFKNKQSDLFDLQLLDQYTGERQAAEKFIRDIFLNTYSANIQHFYPFLLSIKRKNDQFAAIAGIRPACLENLFSENYLDKSIEEVLQIPREKIIEIGNLAPADAGQARWLITTLSAFMNAAGFTHVVELNRS